MKSRDEMIAEIHERMKVPRDLKLAAMSDEQLAVFLAELRKARGGDRFVLRAEDMRPVKG